MNNVVRCVCGNVEVSGSYEIDGRILVLRSRFGVARAVVGLQDPRKLAGRMLKNTCKKAMPNASTDAACRPPTVAERTREQVDMQRDKILSMRPDDPLRASEERLLDQVIERSRMVETAHALLTPPEELEDTARAIAAPDAES